MDFWIYWQLGYDAEEVEIVRQSIEGCAPVASVQPEPNTELERLAA